MKRHLLLPLLASTFAAHAQRIDEVDTVFKLIGPDHKSVTAVPVDRGTPIPVH